MEQLKRYEQYTIHEAVEKLSTNEFVLPSFQRRFVWKNSRIRDLFDTIIQNNLFGSISAIKQIGTCNLFEYYKKFDIKGQPEYSHKSRTGVAPPLYYIIDGQQRLTVLHNVLMGINILSDGIKLFFDLDDCTFLLSDKVNDDNEHYCIEVSTLYDGLRKYNSANNPSYTDYCSKLKISDEKQKESVFKFYYSFFFNRSINVSLVFSDSDNKEQTKKRFIDLFVKINTGGINLTPVDVALCTLKGYFNDFEHTIDKVYQYESFPNIFVNSLTLFKDNVQLEQSVDEDQDPQYLLSIESDYQDLYDSNPIEERLTELQLKNTEITYDDNLFDIDFLKDKATLIKQVIEKVTSLFEGININKPIFKAVLPIMLARLYHSDDISNGEIRKKLTEYSTFNRLVMFDLTSIDKLSMNNFYTQLNYDD